MSKTAATATTAATPDAPPDAAGAGAEADAARAARTVSALVGALAPRRTELPPADTPLMDLGYDSLALVELSLAFEDLFSTEANTVGEALGLSTVGDLQQLVLDLLAKGAAALPADGALEQAVRNR